MVSREGKRGSLTAIFCGNVGEDERGRLKGKFSAYIFK